MMQRRLWIPFVLGLALVAAGCGGSGDDASEGDDTVVELDGGSDTGESGESGEVPGEVRQSSLQENRS